jgi:hypothetical protein
LTQSDINTPEAYGMFIGGSPSGMPFTATTTNVMLPVTDANGEITFQLGLLTQPLEVGDSISVQIKTNDNSTDIGSAFLYSK